MEMDDSTKVHDRIARTALQAIVGALAAAGQDARIFERQDGEPYLVFRVGDAFHVFREVEAKRAAQNCGSTVENRHTNDIWRTDLWIVQ